MLPPHDLNHEAATAGGGGGTAVAAGHPALPLGLEDVVVDLFCRGRLSYALNVGHLLTRGGGGPLQDGSLLGHGGCVQCCATFR
jgi:hypothetical protein